VRAWRRRPLWLVVPATLLFVALVLADRAQHVELVREQQDDEQAVTADISRTAGGFTVARWYDPTRETWIRRDFSGSTEGEIDWIARTDDPYMSRPAELPLPGDPTDALVYLVWALPPWMWWASRSWTVARTSRLIRRESPAFAMTACFAQVRGRSMPLLHLYSLDAQPGDLPLCAVPIVETDRIIRTPPFPVEVKGSPRPGGRVVVRVAADIVWPSGRTVLIARTPRPADDTQARARRAGWWGVVAVTVIAAAAFVSSSLFELGEVRRIEHLQTSGTKVSATVTRAEDEYTFHVLYPLPRAKDELVAAELWTTIAADPRAETLALLIDPEDPTYAPFLVGDAYDWYFLPIAVLATGGIAIGIAFAVRGVRERRLSRFLGPAPAAPLSPTPHRAVPGATPRPATIVDSVVAPAAGREQPGLGLFGRVSGGGRFIYAASDGTIWGPRPLYPWRPRLQISPNGVALWFRNGVEWLSWADDWSLLLVEYHQPLRRGAQLQVLTGRRSYAVGEATTPDRRAYLCVVAELVTELRADPVARAGLSDPARVEEFVRRLNSTNWRRPTRPRPWLSAGDTLDRFVVAALQRSGAEVLGGYTIAGHPPLDEDALVAELLAERASLVSRLASEEQIRRRVEWWLSLPALPLDVLRNPADRQPFRPPPTLQ